MALDTANDATQQELEESDLPNEIRIVPKLSGAQPDPIYSLITSSRSVGPVRSEKSNTVSESDDTPALHRQPSTNLSRRPNLRPEKKADITEIIIADTYDPPIVYDEAVVSSKSNAFVVSMTGFREGLVGYNLELKDHLAKIIERLGGTVFYDTVYSETITHLIVPPHSRTVKTLGCILTGRWIMTNEWVLESARQGHWVQETDYGRRFHVAAIENKKFFFTQEFLEEATVSATRKERLENAKMLIALGNGYVVSSLSDSPDYALLPSDSASKSLKDLPSRTSILKWSQFLDLIPDWNPSLPPQAMPQPPTDEESKLEIHEPIPSPPRSGMHTVSDPSSASKRARLKTKRRASQEELKTSSPKRLK